jgi:superoxide reductase
MSNYQKFCVCKKCGNIVEFINRKNVVTVCCGENMAELIPNTTNASVEKHKPVITVLADNINIEIGSILHPMQDDHHIDFVCLETEHGSQRRYLKIGEAPKITFNISNDKPVAVYAYCNLHGLWKTDV